MKTKYEKKVFENIKNIDKKYTKKNIQKWENEIGEKGKGKELGELQTCE